MPQGPRLQICLPCALTCRVWGLSSLAGASAWALGMRVPERSLEQVVQVLGSRRLLGGSRGGPSTGLTRRHLLPGCRACMPRAVIWRLVGAVRLCSCTRAGWPARRGAAVGGLGQCSQV